VPNLKLVQTPSPDAPLATVPAAQRLLLDILDTVRQPLLVLDDEFRVTHANRDFFHTFRVEPKDTIGTVLFALGDGQWDIAPLREMLRDKLPLESQLDDFDVDHEFPGIGRKIMLLNARLVSQGPDEPRIILLAIEDITERRFTEWRLAAQRQSQLDILDTVRQPLLVLDHEFRVTQANRAFFHTFQVEPKDTIGTVLFALGDGQWDIAPLREMLRDKLPLEKQLDDFDVDHEFPGIGRKIMLLNARLVSQGPDEPRIILLAIEDITERRFTEWRLAAQRQSQLGILDTVREPLLVLDHEFRVTQANRAFFHTFQVEPEDTIGTVLFALGDGQWDIAPLREMLRDKLPLEKQLDDFDVDHEFPGIGRKIMLLNARLVSQGPDEPRIILLAIEDITQRRYTEWRLAEQHRELERSNEALDEFASVASHDLQEPVRKIISFGDLLDRSVGQGLATGDREHLTRMLNAAARMRTLINDLLLYSQVSTRVQPLVRTDLGRIAREVVADLETTIAESGGQVEIGPLCAIDADPLQMRQLLQNLLGNALKYRREGVPPVVKLSAVIRSGVQCIITVADNGIGFNENHATKIFRMFVRLHGKGQYDGSGIGLAICRKIVERHNGTITATSIAGQGATFTVTLPVTQAARGYQS
jgi:signal transduction histidine kinase